MITFDSTVTLGVILHLVGLVLVIGVGWHSLAGKLDRIERKLDALRAAARPDAPAPKGAP